ncbi:MAG: metal ABC transporter permease [Rhodocyclaceae bacterium]
MGDFLVAPFTEFGFMRRALAGCLALSLGATPVGVFLMLRRMSLAGDAIAHAILPGAAVGYLLVGLSLPAMTAGGVVVGLAVALAAGGIARSTLLREDATLATFYLISLAAGVMIVSLRGSSVDLLHVLFGTVLALDDGALQLLASITTVTLLGLALGYRALVMECCDAAFLRSVGRSSAPVHFGFMALVVLNLVAGFHALGTLMAVGIMILPAAAARLWVRDISRLIPLAMFIAFAGSAAGLLLSFHGGLPAGPAIVLTLGGLYLLSLIAGRDGLLVRHIRPRWHYSS